MTKAGEEVGTSEAVGFDMPDEGSVGALLNRAEPEGLALSPVWPLGTADAGLLLLADDAVDASATAEPPVEED